ncbi:hypothetical protein QL285_085227 [Trifolium repens]|nr:hypothetical protein QL285_085227 [Trifolium repens]
MQGTAADACRHVAGGATLTGTIPSQVAPFIGGDAARHAWALSPPPPPHRHKSSPPTTPSHSQHNRTVEQVHLAREGMLWQLTVAPPAVWAILSDDTLIVGSESWENMRAIKKKLQLFELASGLKVRT